MSTPLAPPDANNSINEASLLVEFERQNIPSDYRGYYAAKRQNLFAGIQGFKEGWELYHRLDAAWLRGNRDLNIARDPAPFDYAQGRLMKPCLDTNSNLNVFRSPTFTKNVKVGHPDTCRSISLRLQLIRHCRVPGRRQGAAQRLPIRCESRGRARAPAD